MTRLVALDTETTGLFSKDGDRIIEIALVEITRDPNPRIYHSLFDPEGREISAEAIQIHGHTNESLIGKPLFRDCIPDILDFLGDDSTLVIHNAPFDLEFLRDEFMNADQIWHEPPVIDTLKEAVKEWPNGRHGLDSLCSRFKVDTSERIKHGALIDTRLLASVFLAWKGQAGFDLTAVTAKRSVVDAEVLGAMNSAAVVAVPPTVRTSPPAASWAKHFEGIEL